MKDAHYWEIPNFDKRNNTYMKALWILPAHTPE